MSRFTLVCLATWATTWAIVKGGQWLADWTERREAEEDRGIDVSIRHAERMSETSDS